MTKQAEYKGLPLNLQFFAQGNEEDKTQADDKVETTEETVKDETTTDGETEKSAESKTFTQEDIDRIVRERLERDRKKRDEALKKERDEAERKRLEENEEYKELADKLQAQLNAQKADALKAKKESLLAKAGYDESQVEKYVKYLDGDSDEEIAQALDSLKEDIPPKRKYADPSAGNGEKATPEKVNLSDKGKSAYQRLKEKGKIRGAK